MEISYRSPAMDVIRAPLDITAGSDIYGDALFNARPGIFHQIQPSPGLIPTEYGLLDPHNLGGTNASVSENRYYHLARRFDPQLH